MSKLLIILIYFLSRIIYHEYFNSVTVCSYILAEMGFHTTLTDSRPLFLQQTFLPSDSCY